MIATTVQADDLTCLTDLTGCEPAMIDRIAALARPRNVEPGDTLTREGVVGRHAFVISDGHAHIFVDGEAVATIAPGSFVRVGSVAGRAAPATVRAVTQMHVIVLGPEALSLIKEAVR